MLYNIVDTDIWIESNITLGNIPNNIVGINKEIKITNSLLLISKTITLFILGE